MARRIQLAEHLSVEELGRRYRRARDPVERSRWQILWLLRQGRTARQRASASGLGRDHRSIPGRPIAPASASIDRWRCTSPDTGLGAWDRRRAPRLDGLVYSDRLRHPSTGTSAGHHLVRPERSYDGARSREEERNGRPRARIAAQRPTPRVSQIVIRDGDSFEIALKRFSRRVQDAGILREVKRRRHYEPPSVKRKRKAQARVRKERKAAAKAAARGY